MSISPKAVNSCEGRRYCPAIPAWFVTAPFCGALTSDELATLNRVGRRRELEAGEAFLWEGEASLVVATVVEGMLKDGKSLPDGCEQIVSVVCPADFIGRPHGEISGRSVVALSKAKLGVFSREAFDSFSRDHPHLQATLLERTLDELDLARHWMLVLSRKTAAQRVATFVLEMSQRLVTHSCASGTAPINHLRLPFRRRQIGDILGLTIETVSRQLTHLKRKGVLGFPLRNVIEIKNREELGRLAEAP